MPLNQQQASLTPTGVKLNWGNAPTKMIAGKRSQLWPDEIKDIFKAAKDNPWTQFWYQTDVALFRSHLNWHASTLRNLVEPNAAVQKEIRAGYDNLLLSIRGRYLSQLSLATKQEVEIGEDSVRMLADRIAGKVSQSFEREQPVVSEAPDGD